MVTSLVDEVGHSQAGNVGFQMIRDVLGFNSTDQTSHSDPKRS
jgi:hypothetical protein